MKLEQIPAAIIVLVIAGTMFGAGLLAFRAFQSTGVKASDATTEYITVDNSSYQAVSTYPMLSLTIRNDTYMPYKHETVSPANYTILGSGMFGRVQWNDCDTCNLWNGQNLSYTYTFEKRTVVWLTMDNSTAALTNISRQLPTVGTIIGVMVVIAVVLYIFTKIGTTRGR